MPDKRIFICYVNGFKICVYTSVLNLGHRFIDTDFKKHDFIYKAVGVGEIVNSEIYNYRFFLSFSSPGALPILQQVSSESYQEREGGELVFIQ